MITEMHPDFNPEQPQATAEMPRYKSHKTVWALQIASVEHLKYDTTTDENEIVTVRFIDKRFAPRDISLRGKPTPSAGWYMVQYEDGYISFSPAEQFEKGNTPEDSEAHPHGKSPDLRSFTQDEMDNWFSYHAPTPEQIIAYGEIRTAAKIFAETVNRHVPSSADKTAAMREIRGAVMAANLAVACFQKPKRPTIAELEAILQKDADVPVTIQSDGSITVDA